MTKAISYLKEKFGKQGMITVIIAAVALLLPLIINAFIPSPGYYMRIGCFILIYIIAVSGLDILFGYCGQISLGHAGFFAIGAYGSAMIHDYFHLPIPLATLIACVIAVAVAAVVAFPAANLRFHFLSLATTAFGMIVYSLFSNSPNNITGNWRGYFPAKLELFGIDFSSDSTKYYYLVFFLMVIGLVFKQYLVNSKTGRAWIAIRENVTAANGMGINVRKYKVLAFCTSAFYVALSGSLYGHYVNYLSPSMISADESVLFLIMLVFGGSGSFWGPIAGVTAMQIVNEILRNAEKFQTLFYGVFLLVVILFMPNGLINLRFNTKKKAEGKE